MSFERQQGESSFVVAEIGTRRVALPGAIVFELIGSPVVHAFPHTTPLISGVVVRRGNILPVLDLSLGVCGEPSPPSRFFLVVYREVGGQPDLCAIPVQGECQLISGQFTAIEHAGGCDIGCLEVNGETIEVLGLEKTIAAGAKLSVRRTVEISS